MSYKEAFPNYDKALDKIEGFFDSSDANCACPSISKYVGKEGGVIVFENYASEDLRDESYVGGAKLYTVLMKGKEDDEPVEVLETDDWAEARRAALDSVKELEALCG